MKPADERLNALMLAAQQMAARQSALVVRGTILVKPRDPKEEAEALRVAQALLAAAQKKPGQ